MGVSGTGKLDGEAERGQKPENNQESDADP